MKIPERVSRLVPKLRMPRVRLPLKKRRPVVSVLRLEGIIVSGGPTRQPTLCYSQLAPIIEKAFVKGKPVAVALVVNSPGGSPAQSSLIAQSIRQLAEEKEIPVYTFVEDLAASGGYWLAAAGERIYVDNNSILGSIGVISSSFGFHQFLERHGIERRLYTAGEDKSILDPFMPQKPGDIERLKELQVQMHDSFIDYVKERRGEQIGDNDVFTGKFWIGSKAIELGLADEHGHMSPVMKSMFGDKVKFNHYTIKRKFLSMFGSQLMAGALVQIEDRVARSRFGL